MQNFRSIIYTYKLLLIAFACNAEKALQFSVLLFFSFFIFFYFYGPMEVFFNADMLELPPVRGKPISSKVSGKDSMEHL